MTVREASVSLVGNSKTKIFRWNMIPLVCLVWWVSRKLQQTWILWDQLYWWSSSFLLRFDRRILVQTQMVVRWASFLCFLNIILDLALQLTFDVSHPSQFFITCQPCDFLDGKHVVFGKVRKEEEGIQSIRSPFDFPSLCSSFSLCFLLSRQVVDGMLTLRKIENVPTGQNNKPRMEVKITGEFLSPFVWLFLNSSTYSNLHSHSLLLLQNVERCESWTGNSKGSAYFICILEEI